MLYKLKEHIWKDIYTFEYFPNAMYYYLGIRETKKKDERMAYPTFEFMNAWILAPMKNTVRDVTRKLFYDYTKLSYDPDTWLHGSLIGGDARRNLADILNVDGYTSGLMAGSRHFSKFRKPYWKLFITDMFAKGEIQRLIDKELHSLGFQFERR